MQSLSILVVIPARYASVRFPGKPLCMIAGKSMIRRVWERSRASDAGGRVIVATDDERIASEVRAFGGEFFMTASDIPSGTERVAAVARAVKADIYVNVQGDEPLLPPETIDRAVAPLAADPGIDIGTACVPLLDPRSAEDPNIVKVVRSAGGRALYFSRAPIPFRRDGEESEGTAFLKHIGIYCYRRDALRRFSALPVSPLERIEMLEQLRALEAGMRIHVADAAADSIAVDTPADAERVAALLRGKE